MESLLVQVFATLLTLSQVLINPQALKTAFDPKRDQRQVVSMLRQGCTHMRRAFEVEDLNLDDLVATAMDDPDARTAEFRGLKFTDLHQAYKAVCRNTRTRLPVDIAAVISFYNRALVELPDHTRLRDLKLPATTTVLDRHGEKFAEVFEPANRRVPVRLAAISPPIQAAFIASEDKRFREHKGVDERGIIRAFIANMAAGESKGGGGIQGGSTITQQVAKNLLVGKENTYVRKMREMVVASRMERILSKDEILELYLNAIYLGRGSWGVQTAAQTYFGKDASEVNAAEAALLAGLAKGPNYYSPDRHPDRARERTAYVLTRMREDGIISTAQMDQALAEPPALIPRKPVRRASGYHAVDLIRREARRVADIRLLSEDAYVIRSTLDKRIQQAAEAALQEGLASYERANGRARFESAETNLRDRIEALRRRAAEEMRGAGAATARSSAPAGDLPAWQQALRTAHLPLYDVHWPAAVVLDKADTKGRPGRLSVGLADGRIVPLQAPGGVRHKLKTYDVVYVRLATTKQNDATAELRVRPKVQGAVVVIDNATGGILAMTGGFSYPLSQLNRATQSWRQPGSSFKPLTYLAALAKGLQPTTLVSDARLTLVPIGKRIKRARAADYWSPKNYDNRSGGPIPLRTALEKSRNVPTAHLMARGIAATPEAGLKEICSLAVELQIYDKCVHFYPFVLGAQPVRPLDLARFYATVANEGVQPDTHVIDRISDQAGERFAYAPPQPKRIAGADAAAFYQLKSILQGTVLRGTAARLSALAPYIAGKTGTTDEETDAWFLGFSNEVTVAVWVGYDNFKRRQTLGKGRTGSNTALPIFASVMDAVWKEFPKTALAPPRDAAAQLVASSVDVKPRGKVTTRGFEIVEYLRKDANGQVSDKRHALIADRSSERSARRARLRDIDPDGYASARSYYEQERAQARAYERSQERSWGGFGGGWGQPGNFGGGGGPFGGSPGGFGGGPSTFGQGGGFWRR